jgi:hypothetical protein
MRAVIRWSVVALAIVVGRASLGAQPLWQRAGGAGAAPVPQAGPVTPAEIQRMFDAYALLQAQEQLKIGDEQYSQFLTRFKALQDTRRMGLQQHARIVQDLRRILNGSQPPDESQLKERLKTLDEVDTRAAADIKKAYDALDQVLDVRQQARFRAFEETMEQRKLELVTRARLANRATQQP